MEIKTAVKRAETDKKSKFYIFICSIPIQIHVCKYLQQLSSSHILHSEKWFWSSNQLEWKKSLLFSRGIQWKYQEGYVSVVVSNSAEVRLLWTSPNKAEEKPWKDQPFSQNKPQHCWKEENEIQNSFQQCKNLQHIQHSRIKRRRKSPHLEETQK